MNNHKVEVIAAGEPQTFRISIDSTEWDVHVHDGPDKPLKSGMPFAWYLSFYEPGTTRPCRMATKTAEYRAMRKAILKAIFEYVDSTRREAK